MLNAYDRIKYHYIPGPIGIPAFGNLLTVSLKHKKLLFNAYDEWRQKYGKVYKWFCGQETYVVIAGAPRSFGSARLGNGGLRLEG